MKVLLSAIILLVLIGGGYYVFFHNIDSSEETTISLELLAGAWESTEDPNFVRTLEANGTFADTYPEEVVTTGTWSIFTHTDIPESFPYTIVEDLIYLSLDNSDVTLFFSIVEVTQNSLTLIYLDRGGILSFTRI